MKTPRWLRRPVVHHRLAHPGLSRAMSRALGASPLSALYQVYQDACAFALEES